jgi:hypothetical protein
MNEYGIIKQAHLVSHYNTRDMKITTKIDRSSSPPLASTTKKREGKATTSLGLLFNLFIIIVIVFIIVFSIAVPSPRVFHHWRRKRRVDDGLGGLKTHISAHLALMLL